MNNNKFIISAFELRIQNTEQEKDNSLNDTEINEMLRESTL